jgi:DNA-binding MarR family transcriptional regulator
VGTRLRHLIELLDGAVADVYVSRGLEWYRPRFSPIVRVLAKAGSASIRELADAIGVTHSAASQTVAQMADRGLVVLGPGPDGRQRIVRLTAKAEQLLPVIEAEWAATAAAAAALEAELTVPLSQIVDETFAALRRVPMRERIAANASPALDGKKPARARHTAGSGG